jgi:hypothetical protein
VAIPGWRESDLELVNVGGQNYEIVNKLSGNVLDVRGEATGNGAVIQQSFDLGLPSQRWQIVGLAEPNR